MLKIISRRDAKAQGLSRYFTGKPCVRGHIAERQIAGNCIDCHNARAYDVKQHYEAVKRWAAANPDKVKLIKAAAAQRYRQRNREKARIRARAWDKANPGKALAHCRARQMAKARRTPQWADMVAIRNIYVLAADISRATGEKYHVDHEIPLRGETVSGLHVAGNLRVVSSRSNMLKGNKFDGAYA